MLSQLYAVSEMLMDDNTEEVVLATRFVRSQEPYTDGKVYSPAVLCLQVIHNMTLRAVLLVS